MTAPDCFQPACTCSRWGCGRCASTRWTRRRCACSRWARRRCACSRWAGSFDVIKSCSRCRPRCRTSRLDHQENDRCSNGHHNDRANGDAGDQACLGCAGQLIVATGWQLQDTHFVACVQCHVKPVTKRIKAAPSQWHHDNESNKSDCNPGVQKQPCGEAGHHS